jgi:hypothetical protein
MNRRYSAEITQAAGGGPRVLLLTLYHEELGISHFLCRPG